MDSDTSKSNKRSRADLETSAPHEDDVSSSDDSIGPALPSASPKKKRRKLPYERLYLSALPSSARYSKSLMHREQLAFLTMTATDFLITSSIDGVVKFWKKGSEGVEFVKEFKAHLGTIKSVSVSADGRSFATAGDDKSIKIFDVITFDLLAMLTVEFTPKCICWIHGKGASLPLLAVSDEVNNSIRIFDGRGEISEPTHTITGLHRNVVSLMAYNNEYDCVISIDEGGSVEYWRPGLFSASETRSGY